MSTDNRRHAHTVGLLDNRITVETGGFPVTTDAVFLAACIGADAQGRVLDVGCGSGAAMLCVLERCPHIYADGLDADTALIDQCRRNIAGNGFEARAGAWVDNVAMPAKGDNEKHSRGYDYVITNPPFLRPGTGNLPKDPARRLAMVEGAASLDTWVRFCHARLNDGGMFYMIHHAGRLDDSLAACVRYFSYDWIFPRVLLKIFPLWQRADKKIMRRIIVMAQKGARASSVTTHAGLILHEADGRWSEKADSILRGAPLPRFVVAGQSPALR